MRRVESMIEQELEDEECERNGSFRSSGVRFYKAQNESQCGLRAWLKLA